MTRDGYLTWEGVVMLAMGVTVGLYAAWCLWRSRRRTP